MYRWIGPDGWMVQGVVYKRGDTVASDIHEDRLKSFLQRGYIEEAKVDVKPEPLWRHKKAESDK